MKNMFIIFGLSIILCATPIFSGTIEIKNEKALKEYKAEQEYEASSNYYSIDQYEEDIEAAKNFNELKKALTKKAKADKEKRKRSKRSQKPGK